MGHARKTLPGFLSDKRAPICLSTVRFVLRIQGGKRLVGEAPISFYFDRTLLCGFMTAKHWFSNILLWSSLGKLWWLLVLFGELKVMIQCRVCLVPPFQKQGDVTMCKWWSRSEENLIIDPLTDAVSCRWWGTLTQARNLLLLSCSTLPSLQLFLLCPFDTRG